MIRGEKIKGKEGILLEDDLDKQLPSRECAIKLWPLVEDEVRGDGMPCFSSIGALEKHLQRATLKKQIKNSDKHPAKKPKNKTSNWGGAFWINAKDAITYLDAWLVVAYATFGGPVIFNRKGVVTEESTTKVPVEQEVNNKVKETVKNDKPTPEEKPVKKNQSPKKKPAKTKPPMMTVATEPKQYIVRNGEELLIAVMDGGYGKDMAKAKAFDKLGFKLEELKGQI